MSWRTKTPNNAGNLAAALLRFRIDSCRRLAEGLWGDACAPWAFRAELRQTCSTGLSLVIESSGFRLIPNDAGNGFIIFADQAIDSSIEVDAGRHRLQGANVEQRDLIDLGDGIKADFIDMVWEP